MLKHISLAAAILIGSATVTAAKEPIKDAEMCQARLKTHEAMLSESDSGEKTDAMVADLLKVFGHLCETKAYQEALWVGDTIRGLLASEDN